MSVTVFVGCSFTSGKGFELEQQEPNLWVNLLHKNIPAIAKTKLVNKGRSGASNSDTFQLAVDNILTHRPEYAFVQWTSGPRYNVVLGVETYSASQYFGHDGEVFAHNLHNENYTLSYLANIRDRFLSLHHPHGDILKVVEYTNILTKLAETTGTKLFFINGICPWDDHFFDQLSDCLPSNYTPYTQKILDTETRDDDEIFALYNKIHSEYTQAGGIDQSRWLNLYNSLSKNKIDTNNDGTHPGIKSNQAFFDFLSTSLTTKI